MVFALKAISITDNTKFFNTGNTKRVFFLFNFNGQMQWKYQGTEGEGIFASISMLT